MDRLENIVRGARFKVAVFESASRVRVTLCLGERLPPSMLVYGREFQAAPLLLLSCSSSCPRLIEKRNKPQKGCKKRDDYACSKMCKGIYKPKMYVKPAVSY